jgi:hypothetical protein
LSEEALAGLLIVAFNPEEGVAGVVFELLGDSVLLLDGDIGAVAELEDIVGVDGGSELAGHMDHLCAGGSEEGYLAGFLQADAADGYAHLLGARERDETKDANEGVANEFSGR